MLRDSLDGMIDLLNDGGRICIITFHSLEDRIVKTIFRKNENPCTCPPDFPVCVCGKKSKGKVITRKPILPGAEEMEEKVKVCKVNVDENHELAEKYEIMTIPAFIVIKNGVETRRTIGVQPKENIEKLISD